MSALSLDPLTLAYHELRSPLGLVATAARSLVDENVDEVLRWRCEVILRGVERMLRTTRHVLEIAHVEGDPSSERYRPAALVEQLVSDLANLDVPVRATVSPVARVTEVLGPRGVVETLLQSLLSNAVDHGDAGAEIVIELATDDDGLTIEISNQVASRGRHNGLGAGLYLSGKLAERAGAGLDAWTEDGVYHARVTIPPVASVQVTHAASM